MSRIQVLALIAPDKVRDGETFDLGVMARWVPRSEGGTGPVALRCDADGFELRPAEVAITIASDADPVVQVVKAKLTGAVASSVRLVGSATGEVETWVDLVKEVP